MNWICADCGAAHGRWPDGHVATFHQPDPADQQDKCGWCGARDKPLTEPRDYCISVTREKSGWRWQVKA